ncbi:uncharacterized protein LOC131724821 [Acipenser ruthenus]|uniref:uncharacterized protein LOC131724821 n=1 Tax=Acipenser ruthenus TaxID=7906 RepID=UPI002741B49B|nr:uncharacterized protein LOC131724821 [Acipenser ruthenus]
MEAAHISPELPIRWVVSADRTVEIKEEVTELGCDQNNERILQEETPPSSITERELTCVKDGEVPRLECVPIKEEFIEQECVPIAEEVPAENNVCTLEEKNKLGSSLCDDCPPEYELGFREFNFEMARRLDGLLTETLESDSAKSEFSDSDSESTAESEEEEVIAQPRTPRTARVNTFQWKRGDREQHDNLFNFTGNPGLRVQMTETSPLSYFSLFFNGFLMDLILNDKPVC